MAGTRPERGVHAASLFARSASLEHQMVIHGEAALRACVENHGAAGGGGVGLAEVGDGLEVGGELLLESEQLEVAPGLGRQAAAGADLGAVAVAVEFEQGGGRIGGRAPWPAGYRPPPVFFGRGGNQTTRRTGRVV